VMEGRAAIGPHQCDGSRCWPYNEQGRQVGAFVGDNVSGHTDWQCQIMGALALRPNRLTASFDGMTRARRLHVPSSCRAGA
jgi:hypothetical protein